MAPSTAAAPPMSDFIVSIALAGLSDRPPESKVIPLPASTSTLLACGGGYSSRTSRGGGARPLPAPGVPPEPAHGGAPPAQTLGGRPRRPPARLGPAAEPG